MNLLPAVSWIKVIQNGNLIRLLLDGKIISKLTTLDVSYEREMLDSTDKYSNEFKTVQPANKSFSISAEGFYVNPSDKNFISFSEYYFDSFYWTLSGFTILLLNCLDPFGFLRAQRSSGFAAGDYMETYAWPAISFDNNEKASLEANGCTFSVWLRSPVNTNITLSITDAATNTATNAIVVNSTWTRYSVSMTGATLTNATVLTCKIECTTTGGEIDVFGTQLEIGQTATTYEPTGIRFMNLFNAVDNGTKYNAIITDETTGHVEYAGDVYVSNLSLTAPQGQLATFSCELTGTGSVTPTTI
jgi:hypothetical protein